MAVLANLRTAGFGRPQSAKGFEFLRPAAQGSSFHPLRAKGYGDFVAGCDKRLRVRVFSSVAQSRLGVPISDKFGVLQKWRFPLYFAL